MLDLIVTTIARWIIWLRYQITITGLDAVAEKGARGILFLPNHPALIDPVILYVYLRRRFKPRGFGDKDQVDRFFIRTFAKRWGVRTIPSMEKYGPAARAKIEQVLDETIEGLKHGDNLLIWPAGRMYRSRLESLGATSAVERILNSCPDLRVVLVRTHGLWGSGFSWASGTEPKVAKVFKEGIPAILANGIFFTPRRKITIEFCEPNDLPRGADRKTFNSYLEDFYNTNAPPNTYVPYTIWQRGGTQTRPEPQPPRLEGDSSSAPPATRQIVLSHLAELTGITNLTDTDHLAADLGMDSLARTDLLLWLEQQFGFPQADADAMQTVGDVMLAACGKFAYVSPTALKPPARLWFASESKARAQIPDAKTLTDAFLTQAAADPDKPAVADLTSGVKSYRDLVTACLILKPILASLEGDYLAIMLPASVAADTFYLAALFAGKIPVMVNWTAGPRNIIASLDSLNVSNIITSKTLIDRLALQGIDLAQINDRFVFAEDIARSITPLAKLKAALVTRLTWRSLANARPADIAAVIFTSGSETIPKAVPLTHSNILTNMRDVLAGLRLYQSDRLIGFLPPFHSFGLTVTTLLPLCAGAPTVYHPNPTEADKLAKIIDAYKVTLLLGTPTFLAGILRVASADQLTSLRLAVTGAEACGEKLYQSLKAKCQNAVILEGYGVTECSPTISLNDEQNPLPFTIGKPLPSLEFILVDPERLEPVTSPGRGLLLVRGPSVFDGYLNYDGKSPFIELDGKRWYNTGDLVSVDENGVFTFVGRLKRFVKLGGEMVSLPAVEAVLQAAFAPDTDEGPVLAVEAPDTENPELVLFTTLAIDRETANRNIRDAGLSGLHSIRKVIKLDEMPLLGTGKTNYRALKQLLRP